jgi:hypothetical protein
MSTTNKLKAVLSYRFAVLGLLAMLVLLGCQDITDVDGANAPELSALQQSAKAVNAITPINNVADLMAVDSEPDGNFVLAADLTLINWVAICDPNALSGPFVGTFDGAGHTLTVESFDTTGEFIGVFAGIGDGSASPAVSNLTVNVAAPAFTTATACNVGGLAAVVNKADIQDVTVTGTLDVTYNGDAPPEGWQALKDGATLRFRSLGGTPIGLDGLAVGGIAGTLAPATVLRAQTSVSIDAAATTFNVPVYAGGVVG